MPGLWERDLDTNIWTRLALPEDEDAVIKLLIKETDLEATRLGIQMAINVLKGLRNEESHRPNLPHHRPTSLGIIGAPLGAGADPEHKENGRPPEDLPSPPGRGEGD